MNSYQTCVFVLGILVLRNYWPWVSNDYRCRAVFATVSSFGCLGCQAVLGVKLESWVSSGLGCQAWVLGVKRSWVSRSNN